MWSMNAPAKRTFARTAMLGLLLVLPPPSHVLGASFPVYAGDPKVRVSLACVIVHVEIQEVRQDNSDTGRSVGRAVATGKVLSVLKGEVGSSTIEVRFSTTFAENPRFLPWEQYILLLVPSDEQQYRMVFGFLGAILRRGSRPTGEGMVGLDDLAKLSWRSFVADFRRFVASQPDGRTKKLLKKFDLLEQVKRCAT